MAQNRKRITLIIVIGVLVILNFPYFSAHATDGGSAIHFPIIPWYAYIEYHQLAEPVLEHGSENDEEIDRSKTPLYIGGHGVFLFNFIEIIFDQYKVYPDGHKEKVSGFAINFAQW